MNPRGRQFALGGTLHSWVRRERFTAAEAAVLRRCYAGREPRTLSRYGIRQWAAPLPWTRMVVKDPFAVLSVAALHAETGAVPVIVYRHPAAVLASYRRMRWTADVEEMMALGAPPPLDDSDLAAMATMWGWCYSVVLSDVEAVPDAVVVSHQQLVAGGASARLALGRRLGLDLSATDSSKVKVKSRSTVRDRQLHDFARPPGDVECGWRRQVDSAEIAALEQLVGDTWRELETAQLPLPSGPVGPEDEAG